MTVLRDNTIDVANIKESDKLISGVKGSTLSIQVDGSASLILKGQHTNFDSNTYYTLGVVNLSTLKKADKINGAGLYMAVVEGVDEIKLEVSGAAGTIHWKELGD